MLSPIDVPTNGVITFYNVIVLAIKTGCLRQFVFTSSIAVYGSIHVPLREGIKETWECSKAQGPQEHQYTERKIPSDLVGSNWRE
jgi:nucleoside-diphosphate-sugar epimerase